MEKGRERVGSVGGEGRNRGRGLGAEQRHMPDGESLLPVGSRFLVFQPPDLPPLLRYRFMVL